MLFLFNLSSSLQILETFREQEVKLLYFISLKQFDIGKTFSRGIAPAHVNSTNPTGLAG
jgi:hypothetical protein